MKTYMTKSGKSRSLHTGGTTTVRYIRDENGRFTKRSHTVKPISRKVLKEVKQTKENIGYLWVMVVFVLVLIGLVAVAIL